MLPKILSILSKNKDAVKVFVHSRQNMREGTFDMYGFTKREDLDLFEILTSVPGLGPKTAMNVLATVEPQHLKQAVAAEDAQPLRKISGLGPRTAQRLIVELQNKLDYLVFSDKDAADLDQESQAMEALLSLGYNQGQAKDALRAVSASATTVQDRVRQALKLLGQK
jgi:Holliday junction DNA helicase RuvA